jgi:predicted dehydrogenase
MATLQVAFLGVSHWHAPLYYRPAARLPHVRIIGVSDPDLPVAQRVGGELEARAFADYRDLIADSRPDFIFAFARHCDMAELATVLIEENLPFVIEKPAGLNAQQVAPLRDRARAKGLYVGTGFNFRVSELFKKIQAMTQEDPISHASFRYIGVGGPHRYREVGNFWMLDPKLSGGGCTINLSGHFVDMFRIFSHSMPREVTSLMGHFTWNLPIEDYSSIIVRSANSVCTIETGYTYPAPYNIFDARFSLRNSRHYIVARNDDTVEIHRGSDGHVELFSTQVFNAPWYPVFVSESIDRFAKGQQPVADLSDLTEVMRVIDAAYASDRAGGRTITLGDHE